MRRNARPRPQRSSSTGSSAFVGGNAARIFRPIFGKGGLGIKEIEPEGGFDNEKAMQTLIEKNMGTIFPGYKFIRNEFPVGDKRIDAVAYDTTAKSFVFIEYKNLKSKNVLGQAAGYLKRLEDQRAEFVLAYNEATKSHLKKSDVAWDKRKMVVIAPSFTSEQYDLATLANIQLYRITRYENEILTIESVTGDEVSRTEGRPSTSGNKKQPSNNKLQKSPQAEKVKMQYTEKEYLKKHDSNKTKPLYVELKKALHGCIPNARIEATRVYIKWVSGNTVVCTVQVAKNLINVCYNTDQLLTQNDNFVTRLVRDDGSKIGKLGLGSYRSTIRHEVDIAKAIRYVDAVCKQKLSTTKNDLR